MLKPGLIAEPQTLGHQARPQVSRSIYHVVLVAACAGYLFYGLWSHPHLGSALQSCLAGSSRTRVPSASKNPAYIIRATHGAVASENELCSQIGVNTMKAGGNAVDAAVSTTLCIGVVNMFSSGIGGGGFMTVRLPPTAANGTSEVFTIDFRETAPALSNKTMYLGNPDLSRWGGLAVGVPGELRGLEEAHRRWGTLPWKDLVKPAAELAKGWTVQRELEHRIEMFSPLMLNVPDWRAVFAPDGQLLKEGQVIRRTNLSRTLEIIAREGPDAFYKGPIADAIVDKVKATGGILSHEDLENYQAIVRPALQGSYRGRKIYTPHAPTSGPVLLHMLNLMEHYPDLVHDGRTLLNVHRFIEAMNTRIGDPAFHDHVERIAKIPRKEYAAEIFANITDDSTHSPEYYNPEYDVVTDHGTSHSSIVDQDGMAVALTTTVNLVFGSAVLDPITGVILNDEMDDFSTPGTPNAFGLYPSPYNYPEPGKRPLSSTVPTIVENEDGSFYLAIGGSGGSRIFPTVFQVLLNLDWGMDISAAIEYGRVHDQLFPTMVDADDILPAELLDGLRDKGHNITVSDTGRVAAVIQGVVKLNDTIYAASDSRKNGIAAGY
ncbi:gamma-glutamyltranspeptidase [Polyporus arcularius HHB13444]|uniref:Glutathione hydrolase n=1 Tax=Polyporus arcularius HHB13444 TaxID=1314778 RepID=A0A5C3PJP4_9APHY|nr:gamma-glutamyltranspeptidase [Polyporus arcularius HHB13444]